MQARGAQNDKIKKMEKALRQKDQMVSAMQGHTFHPQINKSKKVEKMVSHYRDREKMREQKIELNFTKRSNSVQETLA